MKNNFLKVFAASAILTLTLGVVVCAVNKNIKTTEAASSGPTSGSLSSKKDINLNDTSEADIRSYYSSISSLSASQRQGTNLLKNLKPILQNFTYYSYDTVWKIYEITDREWSLSPASGTSYGTYNSSTNIISNYEFGSNSSPKNDPYVHTLYRNRDSSGTTISSGRIKNWGSHTQTGGTNREHVWCQSRGFKASDGANGPAGTDVHHLISGDGYVNGTPHNNYPYGYVNTSKSYTNASSSYSYCDGNLNGSPLHTHSGDKSSTVFEPQNADKGDIARACFYMVACYNNLSGSETITQFNPNLTLVDYTSSTATEISSNTGKAVSMGILSDLLAWHKADPVDEYEIHRNNLIYENFQHNRNPFIDFPEWVDFIWGTVTNGGTSSQTYNSTPTGSANPNSDTINGYNSDTPQATLSYIAISGQKTSFDVGDTFSFGGTVTAHYSDNTTADVTSSATFSGYNMSTDGDQTVTVSYTESGVTKTTSYSITVNPITLSYITVSGQQTVYSVGDSLNFSGTVTAHYSDGSSADVTDNAIFKGYNLNNEGAQTVTVEYTEGGITKTTTYDITVNPVVTLSYITVSGQQTVFTVDDDFNFGGTVAAHYSDDSTANVTNAAVFSGYDMSVAGQQTVTVRYTEGTKTEETSYTITVTSSGGDIPSGDAALYSGELTEGDYVIYFSGKAMKNTVSNNRLSYSEVTPTNDIISEPDTDIVWHIAPSGDYWTIYNASVARYAAGNGTKNQGALIDSVTDYAKWTVSGTSEYEFVNKGNEAANVNKNLRNNGTYGFACYSTSTGGALSLYKLSNTPTPPVDPTSITATVNKTFSVGETITKSDITVKDDLNNTITDFSFANNNYQFTYADAASGGALTNKTFTNAITYSDLSCSLTVQVARNAYVTPGETSTIVNDFSSITETTASAAKDQTLSVGGITYTSTLSYRYNSMLSFKTTSSETESGKYETTSIFSNQTKYATNIVDVELTLGGTKKPTIDATIEYSADGSEDSWSTINNGDAYYFRIRYVGAFTGYVNIVSVEITLAASETAINVANYIMFEDTNGQCQDVGNTKGKFSIASTYFENMSKEERNTFMNSDDYVIENARTRFVAWATHLGKSIDYVDGDYVVNSNQASFKNIAEDSDEVAAITIVVALFSVTMFGVILLIKKKKMR